MVYIALGNTHLDNDSKVMFLMTLITLSSSDPPVPFNSFTAKKFKNFFDTSKIIARAL